MENKSLLTSLKDSFKKSFRKRIKKAETIDAVLCLLQSKLDKLKLKKAEVTDAKQLKRIDTQIAILELQLQKAKEQSKKQQKLVEARVDEQ